MEVSVSYTGDGVQTSFPYPYAYRSGEDITGYLVDAEGKETEITTNYKFDTVENNYIYPLAGDPIRAPVGIKIIRETPLQNNVELPDRLPFSLIEKALDWIIMMLQEAVQQANLGTYNVQITTEQANIAKIEAQNAANSADEAAQSAEAAEVSNQQAAGQAALSGQYAENAHDSASQAAQWAEQTEQNALAMAPEAYDPTKTYHFPDLAVAADGYTYRCIGNNIVGEDPRTSANWARIAVVTDNFFDIDMEGNLMPAIYPIYSAIWEVDSNGDIQPKQPKGV